MARPLPKTNRLDFKKNKNSEPVVLNMPELKEKKPAGSNEAADCWRRQGEKPVLAIMTTSPPARNSQTISFSVIAVDRPSTRKTAHNNLSFLIEVLMSFMAERAMIAMTAAPMP